MTIPYNAVDFQRFLALAQVVKPKGAELQTYVTKEVNSQDYFVSVEIRGYVSSEYLASVLGIDPANLDGFVPASKAGEEVLV